MFTKNPDTTIAVTSIRYSPLGYHDSEWDDAQVKKIGHADPTLVGIKEPYQATVSFPDGTFKVLYAMTLWGIHLSSYRAIRHHHDEVEMAKKDGMDTAYEI